MLNHVKKTPLTASLTGGANHEIIMVETRKIFRTTVYTHRTSCTTIVADSIGPWLAGR